jgi:hypothetical protein
LLITILLTLNGNAQKEDAAGWLGVRNNFDVAIALERAGRWGEADALLQQLEDDGYHPIRENRAVSSIAYYRALAAAHQKLQDGRQKRARGAEGEVRRAASNVRLMRSASTRRARACSSLLKRLVPDPILMTPPRHHRKCFSGRRRRRFPQARDGRIALVEADIFADGHDVLSAVMLHRPRAGQSIEELE